VNIFYNTLSLIFFRKITVEKAADRFAIGHLNNGFGLMKEYGDSHSFISLIHLDLSRGSLEKLYTIEYPTTNVKIIVNKANPTTFLLTRNIDNERVSRICKIAENTIINGDIVEITFTPNCFYGKCLYRLQWNNNNERQVSLLLTCLIF
jgi:hypothetical protein